MKIDGGFRSEEILISPDYVMGKAKELEDIGFDGLLTTEVAHCPFMPLSWAAQSTSHIDIRTSVAVALARTPMITAGLGHDLNALSRGRFTLGLGSQIKPHIANRFGMPWSSPARRMREYIEAMHAIWDCWYEGKDLDFQGEFYTHKLMTPEFTPSNIEYGRPKVIMAAVGPMMIDTACAVADGIIPHPFCTEKHFKGVLMPQITSSLAKYGRSLDDFEIQFPVFMAAAETEEKLEQAKAAIKYRLGFYSSTPSYRSVLDTHGWGELQEELRQLTKAGRWQELPERISDEMLEAFAVVGHPVEAAQKIVSRFGGLIDRCALDENAASPENLEKQLDLLHAA